MPTVSVVMPLFNEEKYIAKCIDSLLTQDYPKDDIEYIFVDGNSKDNTVSIIKEYQNKYKDLIVVLNNPHKYVPQGMNIGIKASKGKYIVRLDAHAEYPTDYISSCIKYLKDEKIDADNVGGVAETKARTEKGQTIALMLSSKFGVGNSQFRTNGSSGYVDTVPFGAFKREVFKKYGGYDDRLVRNQDNEMNYRIRKNGGKIYLANDIKLTYYCRETTRGICKMARTNGCWNIITMKLCPGSLGVRHFIPLCFVLSIILLALLGIAHWAFWIVLGVELVLYLLCDLFFSIKKTKSCKKVFSLLLLFPLFHISYGIGSLIGIFKSFKYKKNGYLPEKI